VIFVENGNELTAFRRKSMLARRVAPKPGKAIL
jgi:hypothetical protein